MVVLQCGSDLCSPTTSSSLCDFSPPRRLSFWCPSHGRCRIVTPPRPIVALAMKRNADKITKPSICTADELHYVNVHNSDWRLALWRYLPSPQAPERNHPLLLLSGLGTNAIGFDLSPESSFARFMSAQGYDTWIVELRGAGLSAQGVEFGEGAKPFNAGLTFKGKRKKMVFKSKESTLPSKLLEMVTHLTEEQGSSAPVYQINDFIQKLVSVIEDGQRSFPPPLSDVQGHLSTTLKDFQEQLDLMLKYNWDFDHYVEEDVPAAMEYIKAQSKPKDGKLLAIGHSMGGILLYAILSRCGFEGRDSGLASVTTLASSLDYSSSKSSLKLLLPLVEPAQALNVPAIPLGTLLAAVHPYATHPPYLLSWLNSQISAPKMMHPELLEKLVLNSFCTIPANLLLQLRTVFHDNGLCDRSGTFFYKNHLGKSKVPILALAADQDLICPPEAVFETVKLIPQPFVAYKVFGEPGGPHFAHYDIVGGRLAVDLVYPCIVEFLNNNDMA
ncbi:hypothetical protein SLEP1_g50600 [Rubroshorea leprosula]|uniref:AB hydrolase-1 domain-containing protein n=1 Tax=Rubroshorea leprosula TaxID=152421 RepID=A0AAV5M1G3_9ROSI|nr:hypothetical protein SLEP1_g50600 [Rubroshorea leprosula]